MIRSYDSAVAAEVGVNAAVLFQHIAWWCEHNRANNTHIHDDKAWTYNSQKAFEELFPEFSAKTIRTSLTKLKENGFIEVGNFNKSSYDRTTWYCIGPHGTGFSTCQNGQIHLPFSANGSAASGEPIPVDYQLTNSSSPPIAPREEIPFKEITGMLNERCGTSFRATSETTKRLIRARWSEGFRAEDFRKVIDSKASEWGSDPKMRPYLRPQTLFGTKFEGYLNQGNAARGGVDYSAYDV